VSDDLAADAFGLARFALRLTFVILTAVGFAVSALLIALAYAVERLYSVPALPWAFATLALPACGLLVLGFSTRLATFVAGSPESSMSSKAREVMNVHAASEMIRGNDA
jgi:hypothetical protein